MGLFHTGRRRQYVVDKKFQLRATLVGVVYIVAVTASLGLLVGYLTRSMGLLLEAHSEELTTLYYAQQRDMMVTTTLFLVSISAAWIFFTIWRTHKIAGPIVKLTRFVHGIASGNLTDRVKLRARDELQAFATSLNDMAESLEARDKAIREEVLSQIQVASDRISAGHEPGRAPQILAELSTAIERRFDAGFARESSPAQAERTPVPEPEDLVYK